ncbi:MAG: hypothetical protein A2X42_05810 [Candidatus Margulisbacteria bacterium GWF2_38_17]|nr:MAG: hypothetical protein A2X43_13600 [Candidatus Margulisbacteria bacterium GWD2_39_127]OGI05341.1 MAG: hypothetical protein A2X42_05810 [Candidatus Margulisbacteria bacterium GWF2_38_17]OGI06034.1 MAG: hypothetical protein A2X41_06225 [Candidatus Margulisbacteria bacterium GWE2_39_32]
MIKLSDKKGQAVAEFVLLSGVFLMVTMGMIDYGMYLFTKYNFENAVRNGARTAVKMRNWSANQVENTQKIKDSIVYDCNRLPTTWKSGLANNVIVIFSPDVNNINYIQVKIDNYKYTSITGFVDLCIPSTLNAQASMRYTY